MMEQWQEFPKSEDEQNDFSNRLPFSKAALEKRRPSSYTSRKIELSKDKEPIYLSKGEIPFDPPSELGQILTDYYESGQIYEDLRHMEQADMSEAEGNIRRRFGLSSNPHIVFSSGGSDALLERSINLLPAPPTISRVGIIGPCFPNFVNFIKQKYQNPEEENQGVQIVHIERSLNRNAQDTLMDALRFKRTRRKFKPESYYFCMPTTPAGDTIDPAIVREFIKSCAEHEDTVFLDAAFASSLPDEQSPVVLTEEFPNLVVFETFNKLILPGLGVGYAVMSRELKRAFESVRRPMDLRANMQLHIANKLSSSEILDPYLDKVRNEIMRIKYKFLVALNENGIDYLSTDVRVPITTIDGISTNFFKMTASESLDVVNGEAFYNTHPDMSGRYVRVTIPKTDELIPEVVSRLQAAKIKAQSQNN